MTEILVGPLLRYAGDTEATVWVETDAACEVEVLGHRTRTFQVWGHHYALVLIDGLEPGAATPYEVRLDGERAWPRRDGRPPSAIHTRSGERSLRMVFGSCRVGAPERPPYSLAASEHGDGVETDALWAYSRRLQAGEEPWPDALLLLGDQVYADEVSPATEEFIRARRDPQVPPAHEVADFEEYTRLYREAWSDPDIRWLLSTVPVAMIFDDHDVHDDWDISDSWVDDIRRQPWWADRIQGALVSYWVYQHVGNLSPPELAADDLFAAVRGDDDAGTRLRRFAYRADRTTDGSRWAYHRDFGRTRLLVMDSRAARVVEPGRPREMVDAAEWAWIVEHARGDFDHLILASTLPVFLSGGVHHLEAWNEAVCAGAWGTLAARAGERLRRGLDLEHWAAFRDSFGAVVDLLGDVAAGAGGAAPATILLLGGDVHHAYVSEVRLHRSDARSRIYQLVCSPFRNPLPSRERAVMRAGASRPAASVMAALARAAGVPRPAADWEILDGPIFDNAIATLELGASSARLAVARSGPDRQGRPVLEPAFSRRLA